MRTSVLDATHLPKETPILVAVSGGMDSVVLTHALKQFGAQIIVCHVHHGMRGESAEADLESVRSLALRLDVTFVESRISVSAGKGESLQEAARKARYAALAKVAQEQGIGWLATGHHADDQAETVLLNLARGAGPAGLAGMAPSATVPGYPSLTLVRPMLESTRDEILAYATAHKLQWREDPSNQDDSYRRNAVRHGLIPVLRDVFGPGVSRSISRSAGLLRAYQDAEVAPVASALLGVASRPLPQTHARVRGLLLDEAALGALPAIWRRRILLDVVEQVIGDGPRDEKLAIALDGLLESQPGKHINVGSGAVWRERDGLAVVHPASADWEEQILAPGHGVVYGRLTLRAQSAAYFFEPENWCAAAAGGGPFQVRPWRAGDRIAVREGSAKVKDVLTNAQLPCYSRSSIPVVASGETIVWIPGVRAAWVSEAAQGDSSWVRLSVFMD
ncbi:MAG: tRNA(Ile)-lysidine synthase [Rhodothermales bacterium]|jgi:tRNA(Ile)-lysidine synthase